MLDLIDHIKKNNGKRYLPKTSYKPTATETSPATPGGRLEACWANAPFLLTFAAIHSNSWCKKLKTKEENSEFPSKRLPKITTNKTAQNPLCCWVF